MKILLPIDDSACSEAAVHAVIGQFRPDETEVRVMHAVEWPKELPPSLAFAEGPAAADDVLALHDEVRRQAEALVARTAARLRSNHFQARTAVREGDARQVILDYAAEWHPDLIVLGSHGRRGLSRFLLGSVSENVMRHAACSVEIVRNPADTSSNTGSIV